MEKSTKLLISITRLALGWLFFYAGITKILNPAWSAAGYLKAAKTFTAFYAWLASPEILPYTNFMNKWSLTLLGISLILGIGVRLSGRLGALLMILYYFPILDFPKVGVNAFLVDDHIIYALVLIYFASIRAGRIYGLENWCSNLPICSRFPGMRKWFG